MTDKDDGYQRMTPAPKKDPLPEPKVAWVCTCGHRNWAHATACICGHPRDAK